ncbi:integrase core domain-containing protein [Micromonospora chersina]|uniref:integrase core domain-containing protein n=1 Tax=Micromonospora chersina TaxID=47854 RepID=UPI00371317EE
MGDSYDNAMAEAFNSLHKADLVRNKGSWRGLDDLEMAAVEYIDWYNNRRLHGELGHVPSAEYEAPHAMTHPVTATRGNQLTNSASNPGLDNRRRLGGDGVAGAASSAVPSAIDNIEPAVGAKASDCGCDGTGGQWPGDRITDDRRPGTGPTCTHGIGPGEPVRLGRTYRRPAPNPRLHRTSRTRKFCAGSRPMSAILSSAVSLACGTAFETNENPPNRGE